MSDRRVPPPPTRYGVLQPAPALPIVQRKASAPSTAFRSPAVLPPPIASAARVAASPPKATWPAGAGMQTVQMKPCPECLKAKGHLSGCSRNPKRKRAVARERKVVHTENASWLNMKHYRSGWVRDQDITEDRVKSFVRYYGKKIRGHHSGSPDTDDKEHQNTTDDLNAYKSWHTGQWGWV